MKYILIDEVNLDMFTEEFDDEESAIKLAKDKWGSLTNSDRKRRTAFYVLESVNPDEDAPEHFDGEVVIDLMENENE